MRTGTVLALGASLAAMVAMPAAAQEASNFGGPRIGAEIGLVDDDFLGSEETSWGANAGYDFDLGDVVVGGTAGYTGIFDDDGADYSEWTLMARAGAKATDNLLVYASGGYSAIEIADFDFDGVKAGLGVELATSSGIYGQIETRYGNYEHGLELYQTVIGVGYRF